MRWHHSRSFSTLRATVFALAFLVPLAIAPRLHDLPPPIGVEVDGEVRYVPPTTTFAAMVRKYDLEPRSGDLLDVDGEVLEAGAYGGRILLNGRAPDGGVGLRLREGDRIRVVDGKDRTEPLVTEVREIPGGEPGNPQSYLGTVPGEQVTTKGEISGKTVSSVFRPVGPATRPLSVALTFDDGPWPTTTARVLDILERFDVPATFFVIGYLAESYPELIRAEVAAGMEVANHSWNHPEPFTIVGPEEAREQIAKTKRLLSSMGADSTLFRPPGGAYTDETIAIARDEGYRLVLWAVDPQDWKEGATAAQITKKVLTSVGPGSIILLHDGGGDQSATVQALPGIIQGIRKMGLSFSTVSGG